MAPLMPLLVLAVPLAGVPLTLALFHFPSARVASTVLVSAISLVVALKLVLFRQGEIVYDVGGWAAPYGIELRIDTLSCLMLLLTAIIFFAATLYQAGQELGVRHGRRGRTMYHFTFPMLLFSLNGLFITADFFNFYVFFELVAMASYLLVAMGKHYPIEASWKYASQSILGSALLLIGVACVYGAAGSLNMADAAARLRAPLTWLAPVILVAFLLKGSLFPFHLWQPDAHAASTTAGSAVLAGILINVGVYGLLRFWPVLFSDQVRSIFLWLGSASILFGGIAAWREEDAKRLLGFSSTSQLGFALIGLGWGTPAATAAAILFTVQHGLSKALLFMSAGVLTEATGSTKFSSLAARGMNTPWVGVAFLLGFLSLVGLPPASGFLAKLALLKAGITIGSWQWVSVVLLGTILTLIYAGRAYHLLFLPHKERHVPGKRIAVPFLAGLAIIFLGLLVLGIGVAGRPLWDLANNAAIGLRVEGVER